MYIIKRGGAVVKLHLYRIDLLGIRQGLFGRINLIPSNNLYSIRAELDRPDD